MERKISSKPVDTTKLSPMMRQYWSVKEKYLDQLLFFRLGDFYELFFDDALIASRELELTLTGKECGLEERAPMCGIPYHSSESYIAKLVKKGYKVAICEQVEDPATAKGLVKREIIRVVTPGTVLETNMLDAGANNYRAKIILPLSFRMYRPERSMRHRLSPIGKKECSTNWDDFLRQKFS